MINYILKDFIDRIVVVYLDNIFIFNKILKEYKKYIHFILITLEQANLYVNVYKNIFYSQKIDYLGFKIITKKNYYFLSFILEFKDRLFEIQ